MGWTGYYATHLDSHLRINRKAECDAYFTEGLNTGYYNLIASRMVGSVYYAAVQPLKRAARDENGKPVKDEHGHIVAEDIPKEELETVGVVFLTQVEKGMFYYKDMSETMGPCYYDCPKSILNKLSPTTNQYALEWRRKCRERADELAAAKKMKTSLPSLPIGSVIKFEVNGEERYLQKCSPNYQFKTAWWKVDGENKYYSKKRIPENYEIVRFGYGD